jgi:hypothetical protein
MSKFLTLDRVDIIKGAIVAAGTAVGASLIGILNAGAFPSQSDLRSAGIAAASALIAYLLKNLVTNSNGDIGRKG